MGNCSSLSGSISLSHASSYKIAVKTGDKKGAGTDASVWIRLRDTRSETSPDFELNSKFRNCFERGNLDVFIFSSNDWCIGVLASIEIWRADDFGISADWYVEKVEVFDQNDSMRKYVFPVHRWVDRTPLAFSVYDTSLPQNDSHLKQRIEELALKRKQYNTCVHYGKGYPVQIRDLPNDEAFSDEYRNDLVGLKRRLIAKMLFIKIITASKPFKTFENMEKTYEKLKLKDRPFGMKTWKSDVYFGYQRVQGVHPKLIQLCQTLPENFGVTEEMVLPFLEGSTLDGALKSKKLFICDLKVLSNVQVDDPVARPICSPLALFFLNQEDELMPIAIQLQQEKSSDNPVFLPSDDANLWQMAKMWYNMAEAAHHQCIVHLYSTHQIAEGICLCAHRNLSPSHPIFRLLAPHFLFLMAVNSRSLTFLIQLGGPFDRLISIGVEGLVDLIKKESGSWRLDLHGNIQKDIEARGVNDPAVLPNYPYRDDALLSLKAIENYVKKIVQIYYKSEKDLLNDYELQQWAKELVLPYEEGGVEINGVPGGGKFETLDQLTEMLTTTIALCSVSHAAGNFSQYDEYGFVPNYPSRMRGKPPTSKEPLQEIDLLNALPDKNTSLLAIMISQLLSERDTNSLGDYEVCYMFDPRAEDAFEEFKDELREGTRVIGERNKTRKYTYTIMDPAAIPNSITI